ncbi:MAG: hypothetical protein R6U36_09820 [Candidatus Fermentibacteraceae bacterium]
MLYSFLELAACPMCGGTLDPRQAVRRHGEITPETYMRFAREADMFEGHDALLRTAEKAGLRGETLGRFASGPRTYHAVAFRKV